MLRKITVAFTLIGSIANAGSTSVDPSDVGGFIEVTPETQVVLEALESIALTEGLASESVLTTLIAAVSEAKPGSPEALQAVSAAMTSLIGSGLLSVASFSSAEVVSAISLLTAILNSTGPNPSLQKLLIELEAKSNS